ncbi:cellulose synthase-like protein E1 isoform X2 [Durio zibethinus]|uniref:Cellulose synthase-like protein E1 isoform X2 n=1 Tax=Durio zibethinus TaxID=66656 RepID=A0A6P5WT62_DURZI|nr:cellulose synthase-like protein E1 isoform X2 [Durio zibethinus]
MYAGIYTRINASQVSLNLSEVVGKVTGEMKSNGYLPLFETRQARGLLLFRLYAASIFVDICFICFYRVSYFPSLQGKTERWVWIGMFLAELWFGFYFFVTVVVRWNPVFRYTFKNRLSARYDEEALPGVDIFVCTADPLLEPPTMVINTVLSVMAYDYPPEKLSVYLSDDGGSDLTVYALLEAARFSQVWLPFCRKLKVEPRSPEAYFRNIAEPVDDSVMAKEWLSIKILIDGRDPNTMDMEGKPLPTLVYLSREKRPKYHHHFKAGALNALIRVSSSITNAPFILNVDCDMYSNNSEAIRDALCFLLDEEKGHEIAFVQYPQSFGNLTKNDIYGSSLRVVMGLELAGFDGNGGPCYIGTGCVNRRETLCGMKYSEEVKVAWRTMKNDRKNKESASVLEENCKVLASCTYEEGTQWGKEIGLRYDCPVEDILTGLSIHTGGWRSVYSNPERKAFLGVVPTTLLQSLIQHKRWSEGDFQIFLSKHCPFVYGRGKMPIKLQLSYCIYLLWAPNCFATLYYVIMPSFCLLKGISLFPKMSSSWGIPFLYAIFVNSSYGLGEFVWFGGTFRGWLNEQRTWMFRRTTSYFFAFIDDILKLCGFSRSAFAITGKVADDHVNQRYEQEIMEFGTTSPMFSILAALALLNLFSFVGGIKNVALDDVHITVFDRFGLQILLCCLLVFLNLPIYQGMFFRKDSGKMPTSVTYQSLTFALLACTIAMY